MMKMSKLKMNDRIMQQRRTLKASNVKCQKAGTDTTS